VSPILGIIASQDYVRTPPSSYESIQTITLGSAQANIEFTSIPSTYKHLQIRAIVKDVTTGAADYDTLRMTVNSDTTANYSSHYIQTQAAASLGTAADVSSSYYYAGGLMRSGTGQSNAFTGMVLDILDYSSTAKNKTFRAISGTEYNGTYAFLLFTSGNWRSTSAISSIKFFADTGANLAQYSSIALYGIKG
jgi:hypothetical protein